MRVTKALVLLAVLAVLGVAVYDGIQPALTERDTKSAAADVAHAAAHTIFTQRDLHKAAELTLLARAAANNKARVDRVTLTSFTTDEVSLVVHVTVEKEAKSIVMKHIQPLRHFDEITVSATAAPG